MNKGTVKVINGFCRDTRINDEIFSLVQGYTENSKGGFITVKSNSLLKAAGAPGVKVRIRLSPNDFEMLEGEPVTEVLSFETKVKSKPQVPVVVETDEEAMDRIKNRFAILDSMTKACITGDVRAMIVSGPPGVGKSFGVEYQLERAGLFDQLSGKKLKFEIIKGAMTPIGLYCTLFKHSDPKNVLVFDDCDSVLMDDVALNILKAALDSGKRRRICWNSDSSMLRREGVPDQFDFKGSCIFITNLKFENLKSKKLQDHLEALQSRCHFLDLTINTERDKLLRIRQVHRDADDVGGLFAGYEFENDEADQIFAFMDQNQSRLREVSLRMCLKLADLIRVDGGNWRAFAESTCMRPV